MLDRMLETGLIHLETARGYGVSERQIGQAFADRPGVREQLILQTKIEPKPTAAEFVAEFEDSLARLGVDRVELLALHGVNTPEHVAWCRQPDGCLAAARRLQAQGRVGHVGFSTHGELPTILDAIELPVHGGFDYVNLHWYFIRRENEPAIAAAHGAGYGRVHHQPE